MIITDGDIHDMVQTKRLIVQASTLPLSIIIIGVGEAEFALMNELDGDKTPLTDDLGKVTSRDIVQFVPFNEFKERNGEELAEEVLKEIPE